MSEEKSTSIEFGEIQENSEVKQKIEQKIIPEKDLQMTGEDLARKKALENAEIMRRQQETIMGYKVPTEVIMLPSMGKIYPKTSALFRIKEVEVRHLSAPDEDILTSRSLIKSGKMIDALLKNTLCNKSIRPEEMIAGDKNAIMTFLRISGYTHEYKVSVTCSFCSEETPEYIFNLQDLQIKTLDVDPVEEGTNRFYFKLPSSNEIEFKFLTSEEDRKLSEIQDNLKKRTGSMVDKNITAKLKNQIITVNGKGESAEERKFVNLFVDNMLASDSKALRKYIDEIEPDIIFKQKFTCSVCGNAKEVDIPITTEFFWPDS